MTFSMLFYSSLFFSSVFFFRNGLLFCYLAGKQNPGEFQFQPHPKAHQQAGILIRFGLTAASFRYDFNLNLGLPYSFFLVLLKWLLMKKKKTRLFLIL